MSARSVGDGLRRSLRNTARRLMISVHGSLQQRTPRDTGWAATNWVPSIGQPFQGTAGTRLEAEAGKLDRAPADQGLAALRSYELAQGDIHESNSVWYIEDLNDGSSAKAPAAFVQGSIVDAISRLSRSIGE